MDIPRTKINLINKKKLRLINRILNVIALIYIVILTYPNFIFKHSFKYKNYNIYSTTVIDKSIISIIDATENKLLCSEIYDKNIKHDIYLCNNYNLFTFLAFSSRKAFACNYPISNNVFIANADIKNNKVYKNDSIDNYTRPLSVLMAHEITHSFIETKVGFLKSKVMKSWKNEGYCDYIGYGSFDNLQKAKTTLKQIKNSTKPGDKYKKNYIAVNFLMNEKKLNFTKLLDSKLSIEQVLKEIKNKN